MNKVTS